MTNKSREKELARAAARREEEKRNAKRKRSMKNAAVAIAVVLVIGLIGYATLGGRDEASEFPSPSPMGPCDFSPPPTIQAKQLQDKPPAMEIDPDRLYTATIATSCGKMDVKLLPKQSPVTVNNFVSLAEAHWYNGVLFHRISNKIDIIQAGDPSCTTDNEQCGEGGPGYKIDDELTGKEKYVTGTLAMANSGPDTNGSQFFIVTGPNGVGLPPDYTIFGKLVGEDSLRVAQLIQSLPVMLREGSPPDSEQDQPKDRIWIRGVKIDEAKSK